ncbi:hypothetical protein [Microbacterium deminutum]|uniref:Secreted protein n=1 Tax=Microbacterium deminutum TaxID=344164 RepID=A0ABP5BXH7_9MICO
MFSHRRALAVAAVVCASVLGLASPAMAAPPATSTSTADVIGVTVRTGSTSAAIAVRYRCTGSPDQVHVWVSLKQSADRTADPRLADEGSGSRGTAAAWSQSHAGKPKCDGTTHFGVFTVDQQEAGYGILRHGWAYVQFCLFDAQNQTVPVSDFEFDRLL